MKQIQINKNEYRRRYHRLLRLLFQLQSDPASGLVDMAIRHPVASKLREVLKTERIHEWKKVGQSWHLIARHLTPPTSVAWALEVSRNKWEWHIAGRRHTSGMETSRLKSQAKIEQYFEVIESIE